MPKRKYLLRLNTSDSGVKKKLRRHRQLGTYDTKADAEERKSELVKERKLDPADFTIKRIR